MNPEELLRLEWRPFSLALPQPLRTAAGLLRRRRGWLLRLQAGGGSVGWGEAAPLPELEARQLTRSAAGLAAAIRELGATLPRVELERRLPHLPPCLAFALGAALAELDGLVGAAAGGWRPAPAPAVLLPAGAAALVALAAWPAGAAPPACKWKVATAADAEERRVLELLLRRLPPGCRLRLDANGGWEWATALAWAERLAGDSRLEWLEQPLAPADLEGAERLAALLPVALDESLRCDPSLRARWPGWQVRRPSQEGDPRPLLRELQAGRPRLMLSTSFETGIGARWLAHLAALQAEGPTPAAPGLAPGWQPGGPLSGDDPVAVWQAAASGPSRQISLSNTGRANRS